MNVLLEIAMDLSGASDSSDKEEPSTSFSKNKKMRKYAQTYKTAWEEKPEFKSWLMKSRKGENYAKCRSCDKDLNISSGKDALIKHGISKFHLEKIKLQRGQQSISKFVVETSAQVTLDYNVKEGILFYSLLST